MATESIPRPEYPRPQWQRQEWLNLNGTWEFARDPADSGEEHGLHQQPLPERIVVPFCPESELSGIGNTERCLAVFYSRFLEIPASWRDHRILLHFGAADYETTVWINGDQVALQPHRGGHVSFSLDLTGKVKAGETCRLTVRCRDDWWNQYPRGKQMTTVERHGCHYDRTTGIWQTVWLEPLPKKSLGRPKITPRVDDSTFIIEAPVDGSGWKDHAVHVTLRDAGGRLLLEEKSLCRTENRAHLHLKVPESEVRLWEPGAPYLYLLEFQLRDAEGNVLDKAASYAGLRSVSIEGNSILINGRRVFQRLVLDQGYYPDGMLTAPSDDALLQDIKLSMEAGFNGARLHQKIFEERFLFHADAMGYLVWSEFADWSNDTVDAMDRPDRWNITWVREWMECLARDYNHPCVIGWCPMNEQMPRRHTQFPQLENVMHCMYEATKLYDPYRPIVDVSGWPHRVKHTDVYDTHDYEQDVTKFKEKYDVIAQTGSIDINWNKDKPDHLPYEGQPFFVSEFGGARWVKEEEEQDAARKKSWGYGKGPDSLEDFYARFQGLCEALLHNPAMFGYCYTQLTDVFQEKNGIYTFARERKFDLAKLKEIQTQKAAYEKRDD